MPNKISNNTIFLICYPKNRSDKTRLQWIMMWIFRYFLKYYSLSIQLIFKWTRWTRTVPWHYHCYRETAFLNSVKPASCLLQESWRCRICWRVTENKLQATRIQMTEISHIWKYRGYTLLHLDNTDKGPIRGKNIQHGYCCWLWEWDKWMSS